MCALTTNPLRGGQFQAVVPAEDRVPQIVDRQVTSHFEKEVKKQADFEEAEFENFVQAFEEFENPVWDEYNEQGVG